MLTTISHYRIMRRVGAGGMGEVFLAQDTRLDRPVALKVMSAELARNENQRKRFRTEAKAASGLVHPNVCVVHEVGETEDGRPFLAMEYVEGQTLDVVTRHRRLKLREIVRIGSEVAEALDAAHARQIVHRDIKPGNIMLDARGHAKVLDFGLAKRPAGGGTDLASTSVAQTRTGMLIGTPNYMSPEQALGRPVDHRTDIFSLGAVLYELVAGQKPFLGKTVGETINSVVNKQPEPLGLENPLYSPALDQIIFRCLEKDPEKRYPTARALCDDFDALRAITDRATKDGTLPGVLPASRVTEASSDDKTPTPLWKLASRSTRMGKTAWLLFGAGGMALLLFVAFYSLNLGSSGRDPSPSKRGISIPAPIPNKSIAVLPFDNYSPEPDTDYLSDGLTEEITTTLSRIRGLKVAARNSAFAFKGKREDVRKVAEMLNVSTVLEGSVRRSSNQVRVTAQLINASNGYHLWSETYNATIDDVFKVQEEIARRIAEKLQGTNTEMRTQSVRAPEAHKLYLQARMFWNKRSESGLKRAIELFRQALEKDPDYAAAHAGLAATYLVLPLYSPDATRESCHLLAKASAQRALEIDSACAEAHAVLGQLDSGLQANASAEQHFQRAIELDPNYATAHHWYGLHLMMNRRREEALQEFQTAVDLDPLSPVIHTIRAQWFYFGRDYDRAATEMRTVTTTFPDFLVARYSLVQVLLRKEAFKEALEELDKLAELDKDNGEGILGMRGYAFARMDRTKEAKDILAQIKERQKSGKGSAGETFMVCLGLRDYDQAIVALEEAVAKKGVDREICEDPFADELRDLPQFRAFLDRHGLKP